MILILESNKACIQICDQKRITIFYNDVEIDILGIF